MLDIKNPIKIMYELQLFKGTNVLAYWVNACCYVAHWFLLNIQLSIC